MFRIFASTVLIALFGFSLPAWGQDKKPLASTGWGSLSGKVTLDGKIPDRIDLTKKMSEHADKACCLAKDAKAIEKIDPTWLVDPKTKGIANVMVWIKAPPKSHFPIHEKLKVRKEEIIIDQPHCAGFCPASRLISLPISTALRKSRRVKSSSFGTARRCRTMFG